MRTLDEGKEAVSLFYQHSWRDESGASFPLFYLLPQNASSVCVYLRAPTYNDPSYTGLYFFATPSVALYYVVVRVPFQCLFLLPQKFILLAFASLSSAGVFKEDVFFMGHPVRTLHYVPGGQGQQRDFLLLPPQQKIKKERKLPVQAETNRPSLSVHHSTDFPKQGQREKEFCFFSRWKGPSCVAAAIASEIFPAPPPPPPSHLKSTPAPKMRT